MKMIMQRVQNPSRGGQCRTIKAQYYKVSAANFTRETGMGASGVIEVYEYDKTEDT